jgi:hypothetical protein
VFAWTVVPLAARIPERAAEALLVVAALSFVAYSVSNAVNDRFAPLDFVLWAREHPGTRTIPFDQDRAASVADRLAGPNDTIAIDASYATWIQPVFGAALTRPVIFIPPGEGPPVIPKEAQWVVIDRSWSIIWEASGLRDLSEAEEMMSHGAPSEDDLRVARAVAADPHFKLEYALPVRNQLVFRRIQ